VDYEYVKNLTWSTADPDIPISPEVRAFSESALLGTGRVIQARLLFCKSSFQIILEEAPVPPGGGVPKKRI